MAGMDASTAFDDIGHSDYARELMEKYVVEDNANGTTQEEATARKPVGRSWNAGLL